ncbi:MAG: hypothetical protein NC314_01040 [Roseburia sp.]|nr:hypothetical protein [Ruminococcus sp.]MCM1153846.1 hypothetical protein [Roseburia sp.]MCM1241398.1 hypothetical protein [Roseburia sp.]
MDFQNNIQPDNGQNPAPAAPVTPEPQTAQAQNQPIPEQPISQTQETPIQAQQAMQMPMPQAAQEQSAAGLQNQQPNANPYGYGNQNPYPNGQPYQGSRPYQNNMSYGGGYPNNGYPNNGYPNNNYPNNNHPNGGNNSYPYYNRSAYQVPYAEPGSSLANTAMILGIISIIVSFTFTVYPAFVLGSIAIILALLSKGSRSSHFQKAKTGIICGTIGLVTNTIIVIFSLIFVYTNPEANEMFNDVFEQQYGMTFEEMMEEMENGMYNE